MVHPFAVDNLVVLFSLVILITVNFFWAFWLIGREVIGLGSTEFVFYIYLVLYRRARPIQPKTTCFAINIFLAVSGKLSMNCCAGDLTALEVYFQKIGSVKCHVAFHGFRQELCLPFFSSFHNEKVE